MIRTLLPLEVVTVEAYEPNWPTDAFAEELTLVRHASEKRRREFVAGRACARAALMHLGQASGPILRGKDREPLWPAGIVGSITHTAGYCAAAVVHQSVVDGLGIDAELNRPIEQGVQELVMTAHERARATSGGHLPALVFSAKESVFKAWYPLTHSWLDYQEAEIILDNTNASFDVRLLSNDSQLALPVGSKFSGRFAITQSHVFTAVALTRSSQAS